MAREAWVRGPVEGVAPPLQPIAHALIQARKDLEWVVPNISQEELWTAPGGAASPGFHLRHLAESTDRLLTYARGEALSDEQRARLAAEKEPQPSVTPDQLLQRLRSVFSDALDELRNTAEEELDEPRHVGRDRIPSNVRGLLCEPQRPAEARSAPGSGGAEATSPGHGPAGGRPEPPEGSPD